ncbi:hypothetical protein LJY25_06930 [Hymenobacter sp. BT175]|uniref:tryptophan-rich sensory protein n=1 Tax=Hymenobacter translucens TaxID=2886507 RepID=UPI001D0F48DC|nr:tryptophan-rich sensory protein [Hymenobacter translucens]MCC2546173.1 hypothetical protein [Hymenobacter translucens]
METPVAPAPTSAFPFWRWFASFAIVGNIALNYWANTHPFNGQTMGEVSARYPTPLTPAGYAFSIWGLIFLTLTIYAVWQLLPAQRASPLPDAIAPPLTLASVATAGWVVLFAFELILLSVLVMLLILGCLIVVYGRSRRLVLCRQVPGWTSVPFALYLGWISVATVINVTIGLRVLGWQTSAGVASGLAVGLLIVVVLLGLVISRRFSEAVFPLVVSWALVAIWMAQRGQYPVLGWAAVAGAVVVGGGGVLLSVRASRQLL